MTLRVQNEAQGCHSKGRPRLEAKKQPAGKQKGANRTKENPGKLREKRVVDNRTAFTAVNGRTGSYPRCLEHRCPLSVRT